jgi:hypothetical protein
MRQVRKRGEVMRRGSGRASTGIPAGLLITSHLPSIGFAGEFGLAAITALDGKIVWVACLESCAGGLSALDGNGQPGNRTMVPGIS